MIHPMIQPMTFAMTPPEPDKAAQAHAAAHARALPATAFIASGADDGSDIEAWVGYESLHPLTWVPAHNASGLA